MMYTLTRANKSTEPQAVKGFIYDNIFDIVTDLAVVLNENNYSEEFIAMIRTNTYRFLLQNKNTQYHLVIGDYTYYINKIYPQEPLIYSEDLY